MPDKELERIKLDIRRERNAIEFENHFNSVHIPTIDRLKKIDGKYIIEDCPCYYCKIS